MPVHVKQHALNSESGAPHRQMDEMAIHEQLWGLPLPRSTSF